MEGAGEGFGFRGGGVGFYGGPECFVQDQAGIEGADFGLDGVVCGAQGGSGGDGFEVTDDGHGPVEIFGHGVQREQGVLRENGVFEGGLGLFEELVDGGLYVRGLDFVEGDAEVDF